MNLNMFDGMDLREAKEAALRMMKEEIPNLYCVVWIAMSWLIRGNW